MNNHLKQTLIRTREELGLTFCEPRSLAGIAAEAGYSPFHFHREFASLFGKTPAAFVRELRLARAKQLLLRSDLCVSEIVSEIGYSSRATFSREFARLHGEPPTEFRKVYAMPGISRLKLIPTCFFQIRKN